MSTQDINEIISSSTICQESQIHEERVTCKSVQYWEKLSIQKNDEDIKNIFRDFQQRENGKPVSEIAEDTSDILQNIPELVKFKSEEQLRGQFKQNQKKLTQLSSNIDDLFKKIYSLTDQVTAELDLSPPQSPKKPCQTKTQQVIPFKQILVLQSNEKQLLAPLLSQTPSKQPFGVSMRMFQTGKTLGYGKFGEVLCCRHRRQGMIFGLKKIFKSTVQQYKMQDQLLMQLEVCKKLNHPKIMKSYAAFTDEFHIFLLCEYLVGQKLIRKMGSSEADVRKIIIQVVNAIEYLHKNGIAHRDLKPENILIDQSGEIKICDFGWSKLKHQNEKMSIICGTLDYVCPEMVNGQQYDLSVDLWGLGILTYELIFKKAPFRGENREETFNRVKKMELNFPQEPQISAQCQNFITRLLKPEKQRMTIEETKNHVFLFQIESEGTQIYQSFGDLFV